MINGMKFLLDETKLILVVIYRDYIVSEEERDNLIRGENKAEIRREKERNI